MKNNCELCGRKNKLNNWWYLYLGKGYVFCCLECGISYMLQKGIWKERNVEKYLRGNKK